MQQTGATPRRARGILEAENGNEIEISKPETDYRLRLQVLRPLGRPIGKRVEGVIRVQAKRIDVVGTGGAYIEPLQGTPRRVQGAVTEVDSSANALTVDAGFPVVAAVGDGQRAESFEVGQHVAFYVGPGASFTVG